MNIELQNRIDKVFQEHKLEDYPDRIFSDFNLIAKATKEFGKFNLYLKVAFYKNGKTEVEKFSLKHAGDISDFSLNDIMIITGTAIAGKLTSVLKEKGGAELFQDFISQVSCVETELVYETIYFTNEKDCKEYLEKVENQKNEGRGKYDN